MTNTPLVLVLGGTGRSGALVTSRLRERGLGPRSASRNGSDVHFDWDQPDSYANALDGVDRVYLVPPVTRVRYADQVAAFLDEAESVGVRHVTLLSTYNGNKAPTEVDVALVESQLAERNTFTHSILRPAWVMQNFTDNHLPLINGMLVVPGGGGREAFVDASDIAAVAVETLVSPATHAGADYDLTGPEALTFEDVAAAIARVSGRSVSYQDVDQETWIDGAIAAGLPSDYAVMLRWLTGSIAAGNGSTPTKDVETVTGRAATNFETFARQNAAVWNPKEGE